MRDLLYSEITNWYGVQNYPEHPEIAIRVGKRLCEELLEPLQEKFGRIALQASTNLAMKKDTIAQVMRKTLLAIFGIIPMQKAMVQPHVLSSHHF